MDWQQLVRDRLSTGSGDATPDADLIEEIAEHLAQRYQERCASGVSADSARTQVIAELENPDALANAILSRGRRRQAPVPPSMLGTPRVVADLWQDLRYAVRLLVRARAFTSAAVLMLALGIGAATSIFTIVDAVLLKPLPYPSPERLVAVWETDRDSGTMREPASLPDFIDLHRDARSLEALGAIVAAEFNLTPNAGEPVRVAGAYMTNELLPMLGVRPVGGRLLSESEHAATDGQRILISARLWRRLFGSSSFDAEHGGTIGARGTGAAHVVRTVRLDDEVRMVVGVVPDSADTGILQWLLAADYARGFADRDVRSRVDVWLPLPMNPQLLPRSTHPLLLLGRVAPDVTMAAAQDELTAVMAALERAYPGDNQARGVHVEPFTNVVLGPVRPALWALMVAVGLVLLSACVNVANLLLVRGTGRMREVAVRTALGAAPSRLTRQFMVENAVLAALASAAGVAIAAATLRGLVAVAPADVPRLATVALDVRVLGVALIAAGIVALLFGLVPLIQAWSLDLRRGLTADAGRSASGGPASARARATFVVAEVALAVALTAGAGLMIRSLWRLQQVDPGFRTSGVLKAEFQLPASRYPATFRHFPNFAEMHRFNASLLRDIASVPGVEAAALAGNHPLDAGFTNSFTVVGREAEGRDWPEISIRRVTPGYFKVLGVPLVRGRHLAESDGTFAPPVVALNEAAARRFFGDRDPVGQQIAYWGAARTIVGVVGNERFRGITEAPPPAVYAPLAQNPSASGAEVLLVRGLRPETLGRAVRAAIARHDAELAVFGVEPLEATLTESIGQRRFVMLVLAAFASVSLLLAAAGIYAVISYDVAQRRREIGIRLALGALPSHVVRLVVGRGTTLVGIGLVVGGMGSILLVGLIRSQLFDVTPADPVTIVTVTLLLGAIGIAASYLPAHRAVRTDALIALREE